jgi:CRISPR-associated protein Cmr1
MPQFQPARQYIKPGAKFGIGLSARINPGALAKGTAAFWLLANLGALGSRSNRGAGSIQALTKDGPIPFRVCQSLQELRDYLKNGIEQCVENGMSSGWADLDEAFIPEFDILHPQACEIWVVAGQSDGWSTPLGALNGLGEKLRDFRSHLHPLGRSDHDAVLDWFAHAGEGPQIKRAAFGLPIPFSYSGNGPRDVIVSKEGDRRGSPMHMRVTRLTDGKYVGVLTLFKSRFLPPDSKLQLQKQKWNAPIPASYEVISNFITSFPVKEQVPL